MDFKFPITTLSVVDARPGTDQRLRYWIFGARQHAAGLKYLWSGKIQQRDFRALLHSFEDKFTTIWRDVEVANVEVRSEVG